MFSFKVHQNELDENTPSVSHLIAQLKKSIKMMTESNSKDEDQRQVTKVYTQSISYILLANDLLVKMTKNLFEAQCLINLYI